MPSIPVTGKNCMVCSSLAARPRPGSPARGPLGSAGGFSCDGYPGPWIRGNHVAEYLAQREPRQLLAVLVEAREVEGVPNRRWVGLDRSCARHLRPPPPPPPPPPP